MIRLTQINGEEITVNAELIETIEKAHDTIVTLTTSRRIRVREGVQEIIDRVVEYRRRINSPDISAGAPASDNPRNQPRREQ